MKIISGGQTGVDRVALEVAHELGLITGGWVPLGWRTERGPDPSLAAFGLTCMHTSSFKERTYANVRDADATVWFGVKSAGWRHTRDAALLFNRPFIENPLPHRLSRWLTEHVISVLNVAGNRASTHPASAQIAEWTLREVLTTLSLPFDR